MPPGPHRYPLLSPTAPSFNVVWKGGLLCVLQTQPARPSLHMFSSLPASRPTWHEAPVNLKVLEKISALWRAFL